MPKIPGRKKQARARAPKAKASAKAKPVPSGKKSRKTAKPVPSGKVICEPGTHDWVDVTTDDVDSPMRCTRCGLRDDIVRIVDTPIAKVKYPPRIDLGTQYVTYSTLLEKLDMKAPPVPLSDRVREILARSKARAEEYARSTKALRNRRKCACSCMSCRMRCRGG